MVALLRPIAVVTPARSPFIKTISADSIATSIPVPIPMPTSALARAGASFIPSPTMATISPSSCNFATSLSLRSGNTPAIILVIPACFAIAAAVASLSPVSITTSRPIDFSCPTVSAASFFKGSATASIPASLPLIAI